MSILTVNHPAYYREQSQRPRSYEQFVEMVKASREDAGKTKGIWELVQINPKTGRAKKRLWTMNVITDNGAYQGLQRMCNSSGATLPNLFNNLLLTNNSGSTTLTTALAANATAQTSLAVAALPAAIPSGTQLQLGYGTGNTQTVTTSASAAQGATSITVTSFTVNATGFTIGNNVVPIPQTSDNLSSGNLTANATTGLTSYSGNLATGAFTFTQGTGAGNRTDLVQYTFANATNGGSTSNGVYTDCWIVNVASGATTNNYLAHEINTQMSINNTNSILAKVTLAI